MESFLPRWTGAPEKTNTSRDNSRSDGDDSDEESKGFLNNQSVLRHSPPKSRHKTLIIFTVINAGILLLTATIIGVWYRNQYLVRNADLKRTSSYSPILDLVELSPRLVKINGTLFPPKDRDIGRQMPNPEADRVWDEWSTADVIAVSRDDMIRMGKDPSTAAQLQDADWGLGDDKYAAIFDVYHHLHCLNALRKLAYGTYYKQHGASAVNETKHEVHINHCVDLLTQALQCSGNVNLVTMHWMETQTYPFPDMSPNRKCMDFDKLTDWRRENRIDYDKFKRTMKRQEGQKALPVPEGMYIYGGLKHGDHDHGSVASSDESNL